MTSKQILKNVVRGACPPFIWQGLKSIKRKLAPSRQHHGGSGQDLDVYWTSEFADELETWGNDNAWHEVQFIGLNCKGKVLDVACGSGEAMLLMSKFSHLELHGIDISDFLIAKAIKRGLPSERLKIGSAVQLDYQDKEFDYAYSIGSLEHFTDTGIEECIAEIHRVTKGNSFHMVPVSRSGKDEGWLTAVQSYHNNSVDWWLAKMKSSYKNVVVLDSLWHDDRSVGKWFIGIED